MRGIGKWFWGIWQTQSFFSKYAVSESLVCFPVTRFGMMQYSQVQVWGDSSFQDLRNLNIREAKNIQNYQAQNWLGIWVLSPPHHNHKTIFIWNPATPWLLLRFLSLINVQYTWQRNKECFKTHYGPLVQGCHHWILIEALCMCQETRAYPATWTADTGGLWPEHLRTDPCPSWSLPFPQPWYRHQMHYHSHPTKWQPKSDIQPVIC